MRTRRKSLKFGGRMDPTHWDGGVADALQGRLVAPIHATLGRADGRRRKLPRAAATVINYSRSRLV